jgi:hypothetical protein
MRQHADVGRKAQFRVVNSYKATMSLMLICPQCEGHTELRGTMGSWYLTWCPDCERLWRLEWRTLLDDPEWRKTTRPAPSARRTRSRSRPST